MKYNLLNTILFLTVVLVSCNSVDDVLKPSDSISISILETLDTVRVVPGDTVSFKFMVFTNGGAIKNIDLETNDEIFEKHPEKMTFGLIDSIELTVDENGNLSRDVSSLIVEYPVYIKKNPAVVNNTLKAVFRATNKQGKSASNYVHFKGLNSRIKKDKLTLVSAYSVPKQNRFFNPFDYKTYSEAQFISTEEPIEGSDKIKESIAMVFAYKYIPADPGKYYLYSPDSEEAQEFCDKNGIRGYNREEMKSCVFYRIEGVGGYELDEVIEAAQDNNEKAKLINERNNLDWKYFDEYINDDYLSTLDFSNATNALQLKGGFYAFKTFDNRKGIIWVNYLNNFNNPIPITIRRYIFQAVSTENGNN